MTEPLERERVDFGTYPHVDIPPDPPFTTTNLCRVFLGRDSWRLGRRPGLGSGPRPGGGSWEREGFAIETGTGIGRWERECFAG